MTIAEQISAGLKEALNGKVSADLESMTKDRDTEKARADKAAEELKAAQTEVSELKSQLAAAKTDLAAMTSERDALKGAKGEADDKAVKAAAAKEAARIAAAAGQTEIPGEKGSNPGSGQSLVEQFNAITDPKARGEFYLKHFAPKFEKR